MIFKFDSFLYSIPHLLCIMVVSSMDNLHNCPSDKFITLVQITTMGKFMAPVGSVNYNIKMVITLENRKQVDQYINFDIKIS